MGSEYLEVLIILNNTNIIIIAKVVASEVFNVFKGPTNQVFGII